MKLDILKDESTSLKESIVIQRTEGSFKIYLLSSMQFHYVWQTQPMCSRNERDRFGKDNSFTGDMIIRTKLLQQFPMITSFYKFLFFVLFEAVVGSEEFSRYIKIFFSFFVLLKALARLIYKLEPYKQASIKFTHLECVFL